MGNSLLPFGLEKEFEQQVLELARQSGLLDLFQSLNENSDEILLTGALFSISSIAYLIYQSFSDVAQDLDILEEKAKNEGNYIG